MSGVSTYTPLVYIAGPYSGENVANVQRAIAFAETVEREFNVDVFVPHLTMLWDLVSPAPYHRWLERDLVFLRRCDAVLRMEGSSTGADGEVTLARQLEIPVFMHHQRREFEAWIDAHKRAALNRA